MVGPFDNAFRDLARRTRSESPADHASTFSAAPTMSRISLLPSVRLPSLNILRQPSTEQPHNDKAPLLTLKLSSGIFIDSVVLDDVSSAPVYTIKTIGSSTTVTRNSPTGSSVPFACLQWPKVLPTKVKGKGVTDGVEIQMGNSRYLGGETLLKPGPKPSSARRFSIPNYTHQLKWKRRGDVYWCTTHNLKGPVAVLEPAKDKKLTKINIYETLRDKYDSRSVLYYQGVYILLLDYLIVTSILLLTDLQEWLLIKDGEERSISIPNPLGGSSSSVEASTSQLRKIMYREPIYPKLNGDSSSNLSTSDSNSYPYTSNSSRRRSDPFGSFRSSLRTSADRSLLSLSSDSEDEDGMMEDAVVHTRAGSPAESANFATTPPSHNYFDPSFYGGSVNKRNSNAPPVPPLPLQYAKSNLSLSPRDPGSASSSASRTLRELPRPPGQQANQHYSHSYSHSQSSISPRSATSTTRQPPPPESTGGSRAAGLGRTRSMTTSSGRPLPRPLPSVPQTRSSTSPVVSNHNSTTGNNGSLRRSRSHANLADVDVAVQTNQGGNTNASSVSLAPAATAASSPYYYDLALAPPLPPFHATDRYSSLPSSRNRDRSSQSQSSRNSQQGQGGGGVQRSLPPTPISLDPSSPRPEVVQEELRVAAATVHMIRQQHQHQQTAMSAAHQPPAIRIPTAPAQRRRRQRRRKSGVTPAVGDNANEDDDEDRYEYDDDNERDDEDNDHDRQPHGHHHLLESDDWVRVLGSRSPSGRTLPPLPAVYYDVPPPAYSESVPVYGDDGEGDGVHHHDPDHDHRFKPAHHAG